MLRLNSLIAPCVLALVMNGGAVEAAGYGGGWQVAAVGIGTPIMAATTAVTTADTDLATSPFQAFPLNRSVR